MRDDLLDAQASIDWFESQFPALYRRINSWLKLNVYVGIENVPSPATHNPIVAIEKEPIPHAFNVEVGAYLNAIRSSLDILATTLANRFRIPKPDDAYFPIAKNEAVFKSGKGYKGWEFVKGLPSVEHSIIESLKPYQGGNETLWALHQLDIMRKHRRLIDVEIRPLRFTMSGVDPIKVKSDYVPVATGWLRVNEKTVIGLIRKDAPDYNMKFMPQIAMNETELVEREPIIATLQHFAGFAAAIIKMFDIP